MASERWYRARREEASEWASRVRSWPEPSAETVEFVKRPRIEDRAGAGAFGSTRIAGPKPDTPEALQSRPTRDAAAGEDPCEHSTSREPCCYFEEMQLAGGYLTDAPLGGHFHVPEHGDFGAGCKREPFRLTTNTEKEKAMEKSDGPFLSYDVKGGTHRSAAKEWRPHQTQTDRAHEWWYFTSVVNDAAGAPYFLFWCVFRVSGKRHLESALPPDAAARIEPGQSAYVCFFTLTNYQTGARTESPVVFIMPDNEVWDDATSALRLRDAQHDHECAWAFDGEQLQLTTKSPALAFDLEMRGGSQVMWAKDHLGKEGLIQEGAEDDRSFYYSLPRLQVTGSISYTDESRQPTIAEVAGFGWIDRQWGDFMTTQWEWASFRFNSGARLNLYNFYNAYQVATYQKADGSTQWFDNFVVKQNGYAKTPEGTWVSYGWSYEFPIEVEGSERYTVVPFSPRDMIDQSVESFFEGPSHLIDDSTGKHVGISVNESMDVRAMGNAPYGPHQH